MDLAYIADNWYCIVLPVGLVIGLSLIGKKDRDSMAGNWGDSGVWYIAFIVVIAAMIIYWVLTGGADPCDGPNCY